MTHQPEITSTLLDLSLLVFPGRLGGRRRLPYKVLMTYALNGSFCCFELKFCQCPGLCPEAEHLEKEAPVGQLWVAAAQIPQQTQSVARGPGLPVLPAWHLAVQDPLC